MCILIVEKSGEEQRLDVSPLFEGQMNCPCFHDKSHTSPISNFFSKLVLSVCCCFELPRADIQHAADVNEKNEWSPLVLCC